nr:MAG: maturation protein [Sanya fiers-like virus 12]
MNQATNVKVINRTRTKGATRSLNLSYKGGPNMSTQSYNGTASVNAISGNSLVTHDVVTPGFRRLVAEGGIVNNPFHRSGSVYEPFLVNEYLRTFSNGAWESMTGPVVAWIFGRTSAATRDADIEDTVNRLATIQCWANVEPAKSQLLVTALEAHKSWDTIVTRARSIARAIEYCRKGNVKGLKKLFGGSHSKRPAPKRFVVWDDDGKPLLTRRGNVRNRYAAPTRFTSDSRYLDNASRLWLEYRYGWAPMVYDIIDQLKAISAPEFRAHLTRDTVRTARGKASRSYTKVVPRTAVAGGLTYTGETRSEVEYTTRAYIHYKNTIAGSFLERLNDFGLFDLPLAMWEIVPASFIIDWFVPVGDWLSALTPKIGVEILARGFTTTHASSCKTVLTGFPSPTVGGVTFVPAAPIGSSDLVTELVKTRDTYLGVPAYPPIDVKLNAKRMADAVALLKGLR